MTMPVHRSKRCRQCKTEYIPRGSRQVVCSYDCVIAHNREKRRKAAEKAQKVKDAKTKDGLKTRSQWLKETQTAFNAYIRARDYGKPCISSGRNYGDIKFGGAVDAGHYRSIGAASHLRFHFLNCWGQSVKDNRDLSGNTVEYRKGLVQRIGEERVIALEHDNEPRTFSIDYLRRLKRLMNKRARYYRKRRGL